MRFYGRNLYDVIHDTAQKIGTPAQLFARICSIREASLKFRSATQRTYIADPENMIIC